jgi:hypothetical protein
MVDDQRPQPALDASPSVKELIIDVGEVRKQGQRHPRHRPQRHPDEQDWNDCRHAKQDETREEKG